MVRVDTSYDGGTDKVMGYTYPKLEKRTLYDWVKQTKSVLLTEDRPLWRDLSRHQGNINPVISKANGVWGVFARAAISWGYKDDRFISYWPLLGEAKLFRSSYHVIYTDQPIVSQADNWYSQHPERDILPRVIDLEVNRSDVAKHKAEATWEMSEIVLQRDGVRPIIYSRYLLINEWLVPYWTSEMLNSHYWWLAQYLVDRSIEHPGPPTLPTGVFRNKVVLHQTADHKAPFQGEVQSLSVDWDRWCLGNQIEMLDFINHIWGGASCSWYQDIDTWARTLGFSSLWPPPQ